MATHPALRRPNAGPTLEALEARTLLSGSTTGPTPAAALSVFVGFAAGTTKAQVAADLKAVAGRVVASYPDGSDLVALPTGADRDRAVATLRGEPGVVYAESAGTFRASGVTPAPVAPNDPKFNAEWGMAMTDAPFAWAVTTGAPSTIVAVLDTGIDLSSPEFVGHIWTNPTANGDGYQGDLHGWNFVAGNGNVADDNGHGSHVSGVLGAAGNNGVGVAGVDWGAQIMPLKVLDAQGNGSTDAAVSAVYFAVAHGARVINASWGGDTFSQAMLDALNYAESKGVVFVTAAGNDAVNADTRRANTYPASYRTPNELSVAAIDQTGHLADFSNYGSNTISLAAPGVGILSTVPARVSPNGLAIYDGTSMATPFVAGTVALLAGANPGMSADALVARVLATVKPLPTLNGLLVAPGVVDPYNALLNIQPLHALSTPAPAPAPSPTLVRGASSFSAVEAALLAQDGVYAHFGGTATSYVTSIYQAIDGRAPVASELGYYAQALQSGGTRVDLVGKLQNSAEGRTTRVARWYVDQLGSTAPLSALKADPGVITYASLLASGMSVAGVEGLLLNNVAAGLDPAVSSPDWIVTSLYSSQLGREPDPAGLAYFSSELAAGWTVAQVSRQFLSSAEGHLTAIARLYRDELGSDATIPALQADSGVAYWASLLGAD